MQAEFGEVWEGTVKKIRKQGYATAEDMLLLNQLKAIAKKKYKFPV